METTIKKTATKYISSRRNDSLKLIAMITMFIDHLGHMNIIADTFWNTLSRTIGRISFPIFAYQIALGYSKTKNLKNYIKRLFIFALISQVPYILFNSKFTIYPFHLNVIFLFLLGIFSIHFYEKGKEHWKSNKQISILMFLIMFAIIVFPQVSVLFISSKFSNITPTLLFSIKNIPIHYSLEYSFSYSTYGVLMVLAFHILKGKPIKMIIGFIVLSIIYPWLSMSKSLFLYGEYWYGEDYTFFKSFFQFKRFVDLSKYNDYFKTLDGFWFQSRSLLTLPFIILLERFEIKIKLNKFIGYSFYPLHITFLIIFTFIINLKTI